MAEKVRSKINEVQDDLCMLCAQCWEGECRAYMSPHSEEEARQRSGDPQGLCEIPILKWGYRLGAPLLPKNHDD